MTTFALLHGAWHTATCWHPTASVLRQRVPADTCARIAEERFGARVTRLGGGHSPMLAQPEALADALTNGPT